MRDIRYPAPPKKRPSLAPRREEPRPPRRSALRTWAAVILIFAVLCGAYVLLGRRHNSFAPGAPADSLSDFLNKLQSTAASYGDLQGVSAGALSFLNLAGQARQVVPQFLAGKATDIVGLLKNARSDLDGLLASLDKIAAGDTALKDKLPFFSEYLTLRPQLSLSRGLLDSLLQMLQDGQEHHLILVLSNTSELRPGGGFTGSFADADIASGTLAAVTVHDINDVDSTRNALIIPPKPLQAIAGNWRTADANWFLDFPTSAGKTLDFMAQSSLYASTSLDGLAAITPKVIQDILTVTGPLKLADGTEINAGNFLNSIQSEVQAGQAAGAPAPKAVLGDLAGPLRDKLAALSADQQDAILKDAKSWIERKDLLIYFKNPDAAKALAAYGADGSLYPLADNFEGDYLAVADANLGGGKSDAYIRQQVSLQSRVDEDGSVHDDLSVMRTHHGDQAAEWWYNTTDWNYLQVFTPSGAAPEDVQGAGLRIITPRANYRRGYVSDPDVASMESRLINSLDGKLQAFPESGRNVFGTWQKIAPGTTKTFEIKYSRQLPVPLGAGDKYVFVYESQSGAQSSLDLLIAAPVGFVWRENKLPVYEYKNDNPPGRLVTELTLAKP